MSAPTERTVLSEVLSQVTCKQGSGIIRRNGSTVLKEGGEGADKLGLVQCWNYIVEKVMIVSFRVSESESW